MLRLQIFNFLSEWLKSTTLLVTDVFRPLKCKADIVLMDLHFANDRSRCAGNSSSTQRLPEQSELKIMLTTLPIEIRQNIYRNLLRFSRPLGQASSCRRGDNNLGWTWLRGNNSKSPLCGLDLTMLRACRSMYVGGSGIL